MEKFTKITSVAASLPIINVDTDMIIPKQFLTTIKRTGLGENLFYEMRFDKNNQKIKDFVLNKEPFNNAKILISLDNFGCGSSREHAPWTLLDFGIKVIIAKSFADIFYNNCFKNGILPIILPSNSIDHLIEIGKMENNLLTVDLQNQIVTIENTNYNFDFEIDPFKKKLLIEGLDEISLTLQQIDKIKDFETRDSQTRFWLYQNQN